MPEIGKLGKSLGHASPSDLRACATPNEIERATPKKTKRAKGASNWGYSFRTQHPWRIGQSAVRIVWFESQAARDQSMQNMIRRQRYRDRPYYVEITPINHENEAPNSLGGSDQGE